MNQRIRELAEQAGYNIKELDVQEQMVAEKFAELIVKECALHLHQRGVEGFGILEERSLNQHFGVGE